MPLLVLAGPTAVGKTDLSIDLAKRINAEIISADSVQIYRGLDIGSAKVSLMQRQTIAHHLVDVVDSDQSFSVADYQVLASSAIEDVWRRGHFPLLVGGTGLWIRALTQNYPFPKETPSNRNLREHLADIGEHYGWDGLRRQLRLVDPDSWEHIHPNDHRRMIRALEVFLTTQRRLPRNTGGAWRYQTRYWVLTRPLLDLQERIRQRVEAMLAEGFEEEVRELLRQGLSPKAQSMGSIGYRDMVDWFWGKSTRSERDMLIIKHTRAYAKRQLTWWRSEPEARWLDLSVWSHDEILSRLELSAQELISSQ
ncbi:MAG: tRNA (adenosine(37)-N6)-dimethylallyltransferase MiaA [Sulfobacillus benefaciens]|uniref:tRNA dimethylallyltransferase n=1 Tax=Sulfobacillus benefaciens TaxID=453960 RepID=A0A2T2XM56_9FIRM|nr:MAG: tRNA (adenosine(37)-N6)-dimethylallyltransferase MiaA [Sulfobacillus benefaciens]